MIRWDFRRLQRNFKALPSACFMAIKEVSEGSEEAYNAFQVVSRLRRFRRGVLELLIRISVCQRQGI